jgi:hypothetical protein
MSTTYRYFQDVRLSIDIEVPDNIMAMHEQAIADYVKGYGNHVMADPDSHTYVDWATKTEVLQYEGSFPKEKDNG